MRLLFREGKLVDSESFTFAHAAEEEVDLMSSFILQHYQGKVDRPGLLITSVAPPEALSELVGMRIETPRRGQRKEMVELAQSNAQARFHQYRKQEQLTEQHLFELQRICQLSRYPRHIVCFDTSHIQGSHAVSAATLFVDGQQTGRRLFKLREVTPGDDYGALREVLSRYLKRADPLPDLLLIDGGKGHLHIASDLLDALSLASIDVIAVTKEEGRHDKGMTSERVFLPGAPDPIHLSPTSSLLFLLQRLRDSAHTAALRFHRKQRTQHTLSSALDTLPGIGPVKRQRLLTHFGSVAHIKTASDEALLAIPGIRPSDLAALRRLP
jgi:excinuclease ABC subunit C